VAEKEKPSGLSALPSHLPCKRGNSTAEGIEKGNILRKVSCIQRAPGQGKDARGEASVGGWGGDLTDEAAR